MWFRFLIVALLAVSGLTGAPLPALAQPAAGAADRTPLMVVRFTKGDVYYAQQLYTAVSRAVQIKPDVLFDVVALAPEGVSAEKVAGHMVQNLNAIGVPSARIGVMPQNGQQVRYPEVRLYVR